MCNGLSIQGAKVLLLFITDKFFNKNISILHQQHCKIRDAVLSLRSKWL